jgi:hypothetical protein
MDLAPVPGVEPSARAIRAVSPEPLIAMARPPGLPRETDIVEVDPEDGLEIEAAPDLSGIHMPSPSIAPFVLGLGFCLVFVGLITNAVILVTGLLWMLVGAIVWIRIGLLEQRAAEAHAETEPAP